MSWRRALVAVGTIFAVLVVGTTSPSPRAAGRAASTDLAFIRDGEVFVTQVGGYRPRRLTLAEGDVSEVTWSPDGGSLAFVRLYESPSSRDPSPSEIYVIGVNGTGLRRLAPRLPDVHGLSWSRDGVTLAFSQRRPGVHVTTTSGRKPRRLATHLLAWGWPSWAPDGRRLAVSASRPPAVLEHSIYVVDTGGSALRRLTRAGDDTQPSWSPDGRRLLYQRNSCTSSFCGSVISVMEMAGSASRGLIRVAGGSLAAWSPDSRTIAFTQRDPGGDDAIWVMDAEGGRKRRLTINTYGPGPAWSPNGREIAFVRNGSVFVMNADGSAERRVVKNATAPTWRPVP